jgi:hypothetical protein
MSLAPQDIGIIQNCGVSGVIDAPSDAEYPAGSQQTGRDPGRHVEPCRIPLKGRLFALVSPEDFERVGAHKWHLKRRKSDPGRLYVQRTVRLTPGRAGKKTSVMLHSEVMGVPPGQLVDHRNGDGLDNRRSNLRLATHRDNSVNVTRSANQKRGGHKGVSWNPRAKKWQASIGAGPVKPCGRRARIYLGVFVDPADAARAYDAAALEHYGEFASLNFPVSNDTGTASSAGGAR